MASLECCVTVNKYHNESDYRVGSHTHVLRLVLQEVVKLLYTHTCNLHPT